MFPIDFQVIGTKSKVKLLIFIDPLLDGYQTLLHWLTLERIFYLSLFGSKGRGQNIGLQLSIVQSIFYGPFA